MKKANLFILRALVLLLIAAGAAHADDVDEFVKRVMRERHIPAVSIAVVRNGAVIKTAAYGTANLEHGIPARAETVFKIGSVSKQFLSAGIMLLAQDGKLSVSDKLSKYLEGTPAGWEDITLRHLLTHTSGLVRESPGFDPWKIQPDIDVIKAAYPAPLLFKTGSNYEYSNVGYYALAEIIHKVSGKPWDVFLNERLFAPLGMSQTRPTTAAEIIPNRASGYIWNMDKFTNADNWTTLRPSGAFMSTASDMAKWEAALQTNRILTESSKAQMWTPVQLNDGRTYPYGFAWELDDFPPGGFTTGVTSIRHEGTIPGFRAAFTRLPQQGISVIVLSNLDRAALDSVVAGIAVHYVPELMPAAQKRWEPAALRP